MKLKALIKILQKYEINHPNANVNLIFMQDETHYQEITEIIGPCGDNIITIYADKECK